jgi:hypothetical protein
MTVLDTVQEAQTQQQGTEQEKHAGAESSSRLSAVVEAAYILEAIRK